MCGAMDRITNFLLYARQAFCNEPDARSGCSFWDSLTCTASVLAASVTCAAVGFEAGAGVIDPCVIGVLGQVSDCISCICSVIGLGC